MLKRRGVVLACALMLMAALSQAAVGAETEGRSTLEQRILGKDDPSEGFSFLRSAAGESHVVREELIAAEAGRKSRRESLAYFGQISDFQLMDEESPARVEFLDPDPSGFARSAFRPQETLLPFQIDRSIRQMNNFDRSPVRDGDGNRARLSSTVLTGDLADSQQFNETKWVARLLEGGTLDPSSGQKVDSEDTCPQGTPRDGEHPRRYTGVQDYDDFAQNTAFYDPDEPAGQYGDWPRYRGLLDRAQEKFEVRGLKAPSYVAFGNHDGLVQGNAAATDTFEEVATGCVKPQLAGLTDLPKAGTAFDHSLADGLPPFEQYFERAASSDSSIQGVPGPPPFLVPPDERRRYVDKEQYKQIFKDGAQKDGHGFDYVDKDERKDSDGVASYFDFSPQDGVRFIVLDSVSDGGLVPASSDGNIDDPQFDWLRRELKQATRRDELIVPISHHAPSSSLTADVPDEAAPQCTTDDEHDHDQNPGCDRDPRASTPIHLGDDVIELLHGFPNVIAYVAGHSHENRIEAFSGPGGSGFWEIKSPAIADWPPENRLIEVMDNRDGTLSIFGTMLDDESPIGAPKSGSKNEVDDFSPTELASLGRVLNFNDPQEGPDGSEGTRDARNVELLVRDPRSHPEGSDCADGGFSREQFCR